MLDLLGFRDFQLVGLYPRITNQRVIGGRGDYIGGLGGGVYKGLGEYRGCGWGWVLLYLGLIIMLRVVSVVNMSKRSRGSLVQFVKIFGKSKV